MFTLVMACSLYSNCTPRGIVSSIRLRLTHTRVATVRFTHSLASYPGHVGGGKSGLVSTVCACVNDSGNLPRMSPIMDKLHVVVMRRSNQPRYTACSVAAVFMWRWLPSSETQGVTRQGLCYNHRRFDLHCACS